MSAHHFRPLVDRQSHPEYSNDECPGGVALSLPRARIVGREGSRANPENAEAGSSAARRGRHWRERGAVYLARYTPRKEYRA